MPTSYALSEAKSRGSTSTPLRFLQAARASISYALKSVIAFFSRIIISHFSIVLGQSDSASSTLRLGSTPTIAK